MSENLARNNYDDKDDLNSDQDEFFDIADDPLTDDEDEDEEQADDDLSLPMRSCFGSRGEINHLHHHRVDNGAAFDSETASSKKLQQQQQRGGISSSFRSTVCSDNQSKQRKSVQTLKNNELVAKIPAVRLTASSSTDEVDQFGWR